MITAIREPIVAQDPEAAGLRSGQLPRRALFLDRDGVMNVNHGYVHTPERTDWLPGIFELARTARSAGYLLIVVTNQAGIARGYYTEAQFGQYTRWVHEQFAREDAPLLATYYCPHHPDAGMGELGVECGCRKPAPGMLKAAIRHWSLDPERSILVGDQPSDMAAAAGAGVGLAIQIRSGTALVAAAAAIAALGRQR